MQFYHLNHNITKYDHAGGIPNSGFSEVFLPGGPGGPGDTGVDWAGWPGPPGCPGPPGFPGAPGGPRKQVKNN